MPQLKQLIIVLIVQLERPLKMREALAWISVICVTKDILDQTEPFLVLRVLRDNIQSLQEVRHVLIALLGIIQKRLECRVVLRAILERIRPVMVIPTVHHVRPGRTPLVIIIPVVRHVHQEHIQKNSPRRAKSVHTDIVVVMDWPINVCVVPMQIPWEPNVKDKVSLCVPPNEMGVGSACLSSQLLSRGGVRQNAQKVFVLHRYLGRFQTMNVQ